MSPELPEALRVALAVIEVLEELDVSYHLGGSYASSVHGIPRQTQDVDMVVELPASAAAPLAARLSDDFYVDEDMALRAIRNRSSFNLIHLESGIKIDLFVRGDQPFDHEEFGRHRLEVVQTKPERRVFVKTAEDILLRKLEWYRSGGEVSDRQWTDVLGLVRAQADRLDHAYLDRWSRELGVADLLAKALAA